MNIIPFRRRESLIPGGFDIEDLWSRLWGNGDRDFASHLPDPLEPGGLDPAQLAERRLRRSLCAVGLQETCSLSLVAAAPGKDFGSHRHKHHIRFSYANSMHNLELAIERMARLLRG